LHDPQSVSLVFVLTQPLEHITYGAGPHTHAPFEHVIPVAQVVVVCQAPVESHVCTVFPLHWMVPGLHATQEPFTQAGAVAGQAVHAVPQCVGSVLVLYAHGVVPPHVAKPGLQLAPHAPPLQVATPFTAAGHCVQFGPQ
jgi:hypothetical protein